MIALVVAIVVIAVGVTILVRWLRTELARIRLSILSSHDVVSLIRAHQVEGDGEARSMEFANTFEDLGFVRSMRPSDDDDDDDDDNDDDDDDDGDDAADADAADGGADADDVVDVVDDAGAVQATPRVDQVIELDDANEPVDLSASSAFAGAFGGDGNDDDANDTNVDGDAFMPTPTMPIMPLVTQDAPADREVALPVLADVADDKSAPKAPRQRARRTRPIAST